MNDKQHHAKFSRLGDSAPAICARPV